MLVVQITPRKQIFVEMTQDSFPNKGGYYCEIYADSEKKFPLDSFTIRREQLGGGDLQKNAKVLAHYKVKEMYK